MRFTLNQRQKEHLAGFFRSISLIFMAGAVAPIFGSIDKINLLVVLLGGLIGCGFILLSIVLLR